MFSLIWSVPGAKSYFLGGHGFVYRLQQPFRRSRVLTVGDQISEENRPMKFNSQCSVSKGTKEPRMGSDFAGGVDRCFVSDGRGGADLVALVVLRYS